MLLPPSPYAARPPHPRTTHTTRLRLTGEGEEEGGGGEEEEAAKPK